MGNRALSALNEMGNGKEAAIKHVIHQSNDYGEGACDGSGKGVPLEQGACVIHLSC